MTVSSDIAKIILKSKTIAVVGASRDPEKASNAIPRYLQNNGYKILPVNPMASEKILGEKVYAKLTDIDSEIDIVDIFRPSEYTPEIVREAIKMKPKLIWLQLGIINEEAKKIVEDSGIKFVMNKCLKVEHSLLIK